MNRSKGFTLIELIIVFVIIGVLAGVAIPAYKRYVADQKAGPEIVTILTDNVKVIVVLKAPHKKEDVIEKIEFAPLNREHPTGVQHKPKTSKSPDAVAPGKTLTPTL